MGFQEMVRGRKYEKLSEKRQEKWFWVKRANSCGNNGLKRLKGIRISRSKKLTLKLFSVTTKIVKMYNEVIKRMNAIDHRGVYPNIVFTSHWGLPVLSHSSSFDRGVFM